MASSDQTPVRLGADLSAALSAVPVVGILRCCPPERVVDMATALERAGLTVLEVTLDSARAFEAIAALADTHPGLVIGAGTVRSVCNVVLAAEANAQFVVSAHFDPDLIAAASAAGVLAVPGAATPTEVCRAVSGGANLVKVFRVRELGGASYVKAIIGPLGHPALVPIGGIDATNGAAFLEAGSVAVGVGGGLFPAEALKTGDADEVGRRCLQLLAAIR